MNKIMKGAWSIVVSFNNFNTIVKIVLSLLLLIIGVGLLYTKTHKDLPLLEDALSFSPVKEAQRLSHEKGLKTAEAYIKFYESIPNVPPNKELLDLKRTLHSERMSLRHQAKHAMRGALGEDSDEIVGVVTGVIAGQSDTVDDVRNLYNEWQHYKAGQEIDTLAAGLAGISLTMTLAELPAAVATAGTSIPTFMAVNRVTKTIQKCLKFMNKKTKSALAKIYQPILKKIQDTKVLADLPLQAQNNKTLLSKIHSLKDLANKEAIRNILNSKLAKFNEIAEVAVQQLATLKSFSLLAIKQPRAAQFIAKHAQSIEEMNSYAATIQKLGKVGTQILRFGQEPALKAATRLEKTNKLDIDRLKQAMQFGEAGLIAVAQDKLDMIESIAGANSNQHKILIAWYRVQSIFSKIPWGVIGFILTYISLVLYKTWFSKHIYLK